MPKMNINITSNIQSHTWSGIAAHVDRDYQNDSNKGIDPKYTKYNQMLSTQSLTQAIHQHFEPLVKKHDQSKSVKKNPTRAYKSVKNYLKRRKGKPENTVVLKIGGLEDKDRIRAMVQGTDLMTKSEAISKVKRADNYAFKLYVQGYKKRHPLGKSAIPMGSAETNEDEQGADHLHYNIADLGFTSKGNASMGFSRAVCREYHTNDRLKAMKLWHHEEDPAMLKCMNRSYQKLISPDISFNLKRSGHAYHLEQPLYKDAMKIKDKELQRLEPAVSSLIGQNDRLKKENHDLKAKNLSLQKTIDTELMQWGKINRQSLTALNVLLDDSNRLDNSSQQSIKRLQELGTQLKKFQGILPYLPILKKELIKSKPLSVNKVAELLYNSKKLKSNQEQDYHE